MSRLTVHLGRAVLAGSGLALLVILGLELVFGYVAELKEVEAGYTALHALGYILLTLPAWAYDLFPLATLLGALTALGALAAQHEFVAWRAAGASMARIAGAVAQAGLLLMAAMVVVGEWVAPAGEHFAQQLRARALAQDALAGADFGLWARSGPRVVNIAQVLPDHRLRGVTVYQTRPDGIDAITRAAAAHHVDGRWLLEDVTISRITPQGLAIERAARAEWPELVQPEALDVVVKPARRSIRELLRYLDYLRANDLATEDVRLALWRRVLLPLAGLVMLLLALPFAFGRQRSAGAGQRILIGILIGIGFYLANQMLGQVGLIYGLPVWLAATLPTALAGLAAAYGLRRAARPA